MAEELGRRTALLVEDETLVAMIAEDFLSALGYQPICVLNGGDALAALTARPDTRLAVIDVGLPDMRGDELAAQARVIAPGLSIVLATGYDPVELSRRFSDDEAVRVLAKPYTERDLRSAVASLGLTTA
ncbi:MAG: sensor hybrid histidine kinase [Caulobacteraceae bacterium]|nr:sensor hybrid histidine kinase [Caulobacteraceae bacterium]